MNLQNKNKKSQKTNNIWTKITTELNRLSTNCNNKQLFPTPVSPMTTNYKTRKDIVVITEQNLEWNEIGMTLTEIFGICFDDIYYNQLLSLIWCIRSCYLLFVIWTCKKTKIDKKEICWILSPRFFVARAEPAVTCFFRIF